MSGKFERLHMFAHKVRFATFGGREEERERARNREKVEGRDYTV